MLPLRRPDPRSWSSILSPSSSMLSQSQHHQLTSGRPGMGANSGLYQLVVRLREKRIISVGRHGRFSFPAGYYVYTGSARRGLESRIARHLRRRKRMRWHIDYLLRYGRVLVVKRYSNDQSECELSRMVEKFPGSRIVVRGFGSSDCKCSTHLFYFRRNPQAWTLDRSRRQCPPGNPEYSI